MRTFADITTQVNNSSTISNHRTLMTSKTTHRTNAQSPTIASLNRTGKKPFTTIDFVSTPSGISTRDDDEVSWMASAAKRVGISRVNDNRSHPKKSPQRTGDPMVSKKVSTAEQPAVVCVPLNLYYYQLSASVLSPGLDKVRLQRNQNLDDSN